MKKGCVIMKQRLKLFIILGVEFAAILSILLLIFFAGKKSYTVVFDLNGGTLLSGDTEQRVTQGHDATPPSVAKDGYYLLRWSASYKSVTKDLYIKAVWEYDTTDGVVFTTRGTYCEITGCYPELSGDVYIGAYNSGVKIMGIKKGAFKNCDRIERIFLLDGILKIEEGAFEGCTSLKQIVIPSTVLEIGDGAFRGCESLEEIILPRDLDTIGDEAFLGCSSATKITFADKVETIGEYAFSGCESVEEIELPASLISVGDYAFSGCTSLKKVDFKCELEVEEIEHEADEAESTEPLSDTPSDEDTEDVETEAKNTVTRYIGVNLIGAYAFSGCESLETVVLPESLTSIGEGAFYGLPELKFAVIPSSVTTIGSLAFSNNTTVYVTFAEDEIPEGFAADWCEEETKIIYEYEENPHEATQEEE